MKQPPRAVKEISMEIEMRSGGRGSLQSCSGAGASPRVFIAAPTDEVTMIPIASHWLNGSASPARLPARM